MKLSYFKQFNLLFCLHPIHIAEHFYLTLSGATYLGQSGAESSGNEEVPFIPQISKATA